jgi:hypothetical protein
VQRKNPAKLKKGDSDVWDRLFILCKKKVDYWTIDGYLMRHETLLLKMVHHCKSKLGVSYA